MPRYKRKRPSNRPPPQTLSSETPEDWVKRKLERAARVAEAGSKSPIANGAGGLVRGHIIRVYLLNGHVGLSSDEIDVVLAALQRQPGDEVDPLETPTDRRNRDLYMGVRRAELEMLQQSRRWRLANQS